VVDDDAMRLFADLLTTASDPGEILRIHHTDGDMLIFGDDEVKAAVEAETGLAPPFALHARADLDPDVRRAAARSRRARWCRTGTPSAASSARLPSAPCRR
jgi:hypothetical protein